jgi:tripartite-type tricarboxylate transporter receptor subunit TctC
MADVWSQKLGTPVVIENRTGAGTLVGTEAVPRRPLTATPCC